MVDENRPMHTQDGTNPLDITPNQCNGLPAWAPKQGQIVDDPLPLGVATINADGTGNNTIGFGGGPAVATKRQATVLLVFLIGSVGQKRDFALFIQAVGDEPGVVAFADSVDRPYPTADRFAYHQHQ
jgi:hypothetical protein